MLCIGGLGISTWIFDELISVQHIVTYLRAPFYFLFRPLNRCGGFLALAHLYFVKLRLQQSECIVLILKLRTRLLIFDNDARWLMVQPHGGLNFVDVLSSGTPRAESIPFDF